MIIDTKKLIESLDRAYLNDVGQLEDYDFIQGKISLRGILDRRKKIIAEVDKLADAYLFEHSIWR